ncbi:MAG: hypothetical protein ACLQVK_03630 [Acidimicrobiales bacterium]
MSLLPFPFSISANTLSTLFFSGLESLEADAAKALIGDLIGAVVPATTAIGFNPGDWFASVSHLLFPIEELVVAPLLFAATIGAVLRQDMRRLARTWGVCLPASALCGYAIVWVAQRGLEVTDAISQLVQSQVEPNLQKDFLDVITLGITKTVSAGPIGAVLSLLVIVGGLLIWLELALRSAAIELAVFFMPLALAGLVWPSTAHWAKRLAEVLGALLLAKPVIVGALCLGANALTSAKAGPSSVVTGSAILLLAAFAPVALLKLVPIAEASAIGHLQEVSRQPFRAAERAAHTAMNVATRAGIISQAANRSGTVGGGAGQLLNQVSRPDAGGAGPAPGAAPGADPGDDPGLGPAGNPAFVAAARRASAADG